MTWIAKAIKDGGGPSEIARVLKCSVQAVCFWRDGKRQFPPEHAASLEQACGFTVRRWNLFPADWHLIWPELVGTQGAPTPPAADVAAEEVRDAA